MQNDIKERRAERSLSQAELAKAVGVVPADDQLDRDRRYTPSLPLALALARFFDIPVEEIFDADE